jgi:hypothetical protein
MLATVGASFVFSWASFGTLERLIVERHKRLGYLAMAMMYYGIGPGSLLTPLVVQKLGTVTSMIGAQTTYVAFAVANFLLECGVGAQGQLLLPTALGVGITASTLHASRAVYVNHLSQRYDALTPAGSHGSVGFFSGIVSACSTGGTLFGLLFSSTLMRWNVGTREREIGGPGGSLEPPACASSYAPPYQFYGVC